MKTIALIIGSIILSFLLFAGGCYSLSKHIFSRQDCERFNIDNIEVRTGIDIPAVENSECECNDNVKESSFVLKKKSEEEWKRYISRNGFKQVDEIYIKGAENEYTKWSAELNQQTAQLSFHIEYKQ